MQNLSAFISEYEGKLNRLTDNITAGNLKTIEGSLERLEQVRKQLDVTGYRLVFIGSFTNEVLRALNSKQEL